MDYKRAQCTVNGIMASILSVTLKNVKIFMTKSIDILYQNLQEICNFQREPCICVGKTAMLRNMEEFHQDGCDDS